MDAAPSSSTAITPSGAAAHSSRSSVSSALPRDDDGPAVLRAWQTDELVAEVLAHLPLVERCRARRVSTTALRAFALAHKWGAVRIRGAPEDAAQEPGAVGEAVATLPPGAVRSLHLEGAILPSPGVAPRAARVFGALTNLSLAHAHVGSGAALQNALDACERLTRLDISNLRVHDRAWWHSPISIRADYQSQYGAVVGFAFLKFEPFRACVELLRGLRSLRTLIARNADDFHDHTMPSWTVVAAGKHCPTLEALYVGWASEFEPRHVDAVLEPPRSAQPCRAAMPLQEMSSLVNLRSISLAGCVNVRDGPLVSGLRGKHLSLLDLST